MSWKNERFEYICNGIPMTVTASFEVNLPSFYDCQSQMIALIIVTGFNEIMPQSYTCHD